MSLPQQTQLNIPHKNNNKQQKKKKEVERNLLKTESEKKSWEELKEKYKNIKRSQYCKFLILISSIAFVIISICLAIVGFTQHATPYFIFSFIPYFFLFAILSICGAPYPLSKKKSSNEYLYQDDYTYQEWIAQFSIGCICWGPFALCIIVWITTEAKVISILMIISHLLIYCFGYNAFRIFSTPQYFKDPGSDEDEEDED